MWRLLMAVTLLVAPGPWLGAQSPATRSSDEAAVRGLIDRYVNARDARDPAAVGALFTADADQYTTGGDWRRGRAQVVAGTAASSQQNPGDRRIDIAAVRFITPDAAIADGDYAIAGSTTKRWTSIVAVREAGEWRIAAIRNMIPTGGR